MEKEVPPKEPTYIRRMEKLLNVLGPVVTPAFWILLVFAILTGIVLGGLAAKHLTFGLAELNLVNTANMAQAIAGTMGTLLSALASLLLIMTLLVQINEYRATRAELINSVDAQKAMAKANDEQLAPLRDQARSTRQALKIELLTGLILDVKNDMRSFNCEELNPTARGCRVVLPMLLADFAADRSWRDELKCNPVPQAAHMMFVAFSRTLMQLDLILERVVLIDRDLDDDELPSTIRISRRNDLLFFVNMELRELATEIKNAEMRLHSMGAFPSFLEHYRNLCIKRLERTFLRMLMFEDQLGKLNRITQ